MYCHLDVLLSAIKMYDHSSLPSLCFWSSQPIASDYGRSQLAAVPHNVLWLVLPVAF
jgi:hypothetical protein